MAWLDSCKARLRAVSAVLAPWVTEMCFEDLAHDLDGELRRAVAAIPGARDRPLNSASQHHRKLADGRSGELCRMWRAEHAGYAPAG